MTNISSSYTRLSATGLVCIAGLALAFAWRADRRDRAQLAAELATANQALTQADARQHTRDTQLQQALAAIAAQKRAITTPPQILKDLPNRLPLPRPITGAPVGAQETLFALSRRTGARLAASAAHPDTRQPTPTSHPVAQACGLCRPEGLEATPPEQNVGRMGAALGAIVMPTDDLKPLYDFALDCQACQAKLTAAQADLTDEKAKSATLTKERDEAVRVAKGGSALRRIARAAKWFLIGAAAGAIASRGAH